MSVSQTTHPPRHSGGPRKPHSSAAENRFHAPCALPSAHTHHAKSKTPSFSASRRGELAIEGGIRQMVHVERQPPNPSRLSPTSRSAPAPAPPRPPTTPDGRRPGTPRKAAQVIGPPPSFPLCATALLFLKLTCRSPFPSVGFLG